MLFFFCIIILLLPNVLQGTKRQNYWMQSGMFELEESLNVLKMHNEGIARNIVIFVGDGLGPNTVTASRVYKNQYWKKNGKHSKSGKGDEESLIFEEFPSIGLLKTYAVDKQVPDSACTATALFCGAKTNYETVAVDESVPLGDCEASLNTSTHLPSVLKWAIESGKDAGFVTNMRVTHATPSPLYAHCAERRWECDGKLPETALNKCKDIARQLIEDEPGKNIKVIMGGGRQCLQTHFNVSDYDPLDTWACRRKDGLDLITAWKMDKESRNLPHQVLSNAGDLRAMLREGNTSKHILGIFANGHMPYEFLRNDSDAGSPSLAEMVVAAIDVLHHNPKGFVLVVESGLIDIAHHRGNARKALHETVAMEEAVIAAIDKLSLSSPPVTNPLSSSPLVRPSFRPNISSDTLLIVTSDHTHTMSINGYPKRGNDILGVASVSKSDGVAYTTLTYALGQGYKYNCTDSGNIKRHDPETADTSSFDYIQQAAILRDEDSHGGGDVTVYATGPMAHLFHRVHEQNYVAHVMAYAARIGPYSDDPKSASSKSKSTGCSSKAGFISATHLLISLWMQFVMK